MVRSTVFVVLAALLAGVGTRANAEELQGSTLRAWQAYLCEANARMQERLEGKKPFLWMEDEAGRGRRVKRGEIVVAPLTGHGTEAVPDGLIHDWIGAVFIPGASIQNLLTLVHDYDQYQDIYKPVVIHSRSLDAGKNEQDFSMVWEKHVLFVNAAMQGRYHAHDVLIGPHRGYSVVDATSLRQIADYGRPAQHLMPPDTGSGFIWRIYSISRYEERDGGVYLEIEAIALSRGIPGSLHWLVSPVVNHLSINSLTTTLRQTRKAVDARAVPQQRLAAAGFKGLK